MSWQVSSRARSIRASLIRSVRAKMGAETLDLGLGQPDLEVPAPVRDAIASEVARARASYGPNLGQPAARAAVASRYGVRDGEVMITCGVQQALAVAMLGLIEPGDEVLVPDPGFPAYPNLVRVAGGVPVDYPLDASRGWDVDLGALEALRTERTRAIVVNSPHNPTGAVLSPERARELARWARERSVLVISDEIYEDYLYDGREHTSPAVCEGEWVGVKLGGLSKSHHMMGWRAGWLVGPEELVEGLKGLHQHMVTSAPTLVQAGVAPAIESLDAVRAETMRVFEARRRVAHEGVARCEGVRVVPGQGAFYLLLDAREALLEGETSIELAGAILAREDVMVVPGAGFGPGGEGHLRLAYTVDEAKLSEALVRLERFFGARAERHATTSGSADVAEQ